MDRHDGRVIWLTYEPEDGKFERTLYMVGKGITYDTGGADIKAGGIMVNHCHWRHNTLSCHYPRLACLVTSVEPQLPRG